MTFILKRVLTIGTKNDYDKGIIIPDPNYEIVYSGNYKYVCDNKNLNKKAVPNSWQYKNSTSQGNDFSECFPPSANLSKDIFKISANPVKVEFGPYNSSNLTHNYIQSTYKITDIKPDEVVNIYNLIKTVTIYYNGKSGDSALKDFEKTFLHTICYQKSNNPMFEKDPVSGESLAYSSYFRSKDPIGDLCRTWELDKDSQKEVNADKITYCNNNKTSFECIILNKSNNNIYNSYLNPDKVADQCWFTPYSEIISGTKINVYFLPSDYDPSTKCKSIDKVKFDENNKLGVTAAQAKPYLITNALPPDNKTFWQKYRLYILSFIALILIIWLIILIIKNIRNKKKIKKIDLII